VRRRRKVASRICIVYERRQVLRRSRQPGKLPSPYSSGTPNLPGFGNSVYNNNRTADPDIRRKWDAQYPSLWVTNGGGGTFKDIWNASTFAQAGMHVSDTKTEGRVYAMSSEHHVRNEIKFTRASNWQVYALQMEEERGEGPNVLPSASRTAQI